MPYDVYGNYVPATGGGGLLGNIAQNPLFGAGLGLLSTTGTHLQPQSPFAGALEGLQYSSNAQQQAAQNELIRAKLSENAKQTAATEKLAELATTGGFGDVSTLLPGATNETLAAAIRADPSIIGKLVRQPLSASDQIALANAQLMAAKLAGEVAKTQQDVSQQTGETLGTTTKAFGDVKTIGEASQRLEAAGSMFQPGGVFSGAPLDYAVSGLMGLKAAGFTKTPSGVSIDEALRNATDALTIDKATASLTTQIQSQIPSMRSNANLQNIQTAMATKMPWSAKRRVLINNLDGMFADIEAQGLQDRLPQYEDMKKFNEELKRQDEAFTKGGGKVEIPTEVPTSSTPNLFDYAGSALDKAGAAVAPYFGEGAAAATPPPPLPPGAGMPPGAATAPPGGPAAPGRAAMAIDPKTGEQGRVWPRPADGERAIKAQLGPDAVGRRFIAINPKTGKPQVYTVTE